MHRRKNVVLVFTLIVFGLVTFVMFSLYLKVSDTTRLSPDYLRGLLEANDAHSVTASRLHKRGDNVHNVCLKSSIDMPLKCNIPKIKETLKYVADRKLIYCAIEKTGSTFWKRILHVIGGWGNSSNPTDILTKDADAKNGGFKTLKDKSLEEIKGLFGNSTGIVFVRDPYTRLLSGWLDKFYSTNPVYWKQLGRTIVKQERGNSTKISRTCGHDVTFPEFVRYIVKALNSSACLDMHFAPSHQHCLPCAFNYDYIGKYETLREDTLFLKNKLNLQITFSNFEKDADFDAIRDAAMWVFQQKNEIIKCTPFRCGLFRVWKRLQSRGILSKNAEFPLQTNKQAENTTMEEFHKILLTEYSKHDQSQTKQNRIEVLAEAYQSLRLIDLNRFIKYFNSDFQLFDYETKPAFLTIEFSQKFSYLKDCPYSFTDP